MTKYEIILYWSNEDQAFIAEVPELAGCAADEIRVLAGLEMPRHTADFQVSGNNAFDLLRQCAQCVEQSISVCGGKIADASEV